MKNVLLPVHADPGQETRLRAALDLTRALGGHLTCLAMIAPPKPTAAPWSGDAHATLAEAPRDGERPDARRLHQRLATEDVSWNWSEATDDRVTTLFSAARLADVIVASPMIRSLLGGGERDWAADILTRCRIPVIAVPERSPPFRLDGRALVAWNGSDESATALRAATPLLRLASRTLLLEIDDGTVPTPAEDAALYLARHGIASVIRRERGHHAPVAAMLRDALRTGRYDYLVMGAYSPARITEALLGDVSRDMLRHCPMPVFMAH